MTFENFLKIWEKDTKVSLAVVKTFERTGIHGNQNKKKSKCSVSYPPRGTVYNYLKNFQELHSGKILTVKALNENNVFVLISEPKEQKEDDVND